MDLTVQAFPIQWVSWRAATRGLFEIDGVPAGVLRKFSRRRVEIEERAEQLTGITASEVSRERRHGIALATHQAKEYRVDGIRWQEAALGRRPRPPLRVHARVGLHRPQPCAGQHTDPPHQRTATP